MKMNKVFAAGLTCSAVFGCALVISGCGGGSRSPAGLADTALNTSATYQEQEKAIVDLGSMPPNEPGVRENLRKVLDKSDNPAIRALAIQALGNSLDFDSGPLIIKALSSDDKTERARAYRAISKIIGTDLPGYDANSADPADRKAGIDSITNTYEFFKSKPEYVEKLRARQGPGK